MQTSIPILPSGDVLVYKFGIRLDESSEKLAGDQIVMARHLYNDIVAVMRTQVQARSEKELALGGADAQNIKSQIESLTEHFKAAKEVNNESEMQSIAAERREHWGKLGLALKGVRAEHKQELKTYIEPIGRTAASKTYQLRSEYVKNGLGWATANAVLDNVLQAFQSTIKTGQAPQFARGDDKIKDTLTLQFTAAGGVAVSRILAGEHNEFKLALPHNGYGKRRYGELRFRLGAAKSDTWATGTWQAHRAIPEDANIAGVSLVRERLGTKYHWNIQLLLKLKSPVKVTTKDRQPLAVLHLGWSADSTGRRIAAIADAPDAGLAKLIQLPPSIEVDLDYSKGLQSARDGARDALHAQLKAVAKDFWDKLPIVELADEIKAILRLPPQHVAIARLHRFLWRSRTAMVDLTGVAVLENWRKQDKLAQQAAAGIAKRARNCRRDFYRKLALDQCRQYSSIVIDSVDLKEAAVVVDEKSGERSALAKKARAGRVVAALYEFVSALKWAASRCDTAIIESNGKAVTLCSTCGGIGLQTVEGTQYQQQQCPHCGVVHDRKQNAAAAVYQMLCRNAQDYAIQSLEAKEKASVERVQKQRERLDKVHAASAARREKQARESVVVENSQ